ncbi:MAG: FAD:protein FMN transferase, partial [Saprospiraceae bacterium]
MKIGHYVIVLFIAVLFSACKSVNKKLISIEGKAQGTTWHISYLADEAISYKSGIESILKDLDSSLSTYLPASIISRINRNDSTVILDHYFIDVFVKAREVSQKTEGLFDVTVGPLVNAWGYGFANRDKIDSKLIDSLLKYVGYHWVHLTDHKLIKDKPQIVLDFNAIAQGYSVDVLANYLESKNITNYLVELGGE